MTERRKGQAKTRRTLPKPTETGSRRGAQREDASGRGAPPIGALRALIVTLVILALARALLVFVPAMWGWGPNLMRFLPPLAAWLPWGIAALALVPPLARILAPALTRLGDGIARAPIWTGLLAALLAAILVWALPDRVRFVGDFLLRQGALTMGAPMGTLIPQALPLDLLLHYRLPIALASGGIVDVGTSARVLGAIDVALLAMLAVGFAHVLDSGGVAAVAAAAVVFFGGYLALFTGYSKAFVELTVITAAVGVFGVRALKQGRGLLGLGIALAIGLALHRSAIALLPAAAGVWVLWLRRHAAAGAWRQPAALAGLALPLVVLAFMLPRILSALFNFDAAMHLQRNDVPGQSIWGALLGGTRGVDVINLILMLSPLALSIPFLWWTLRGRLGAEMGYLTVLVLSWLAVLVAVRPLQGLHRDWDIFAAGGVALSLLAAVLVNETLRGAGRQSWLGVAVTVAVMMPALQLLIHQTSADRGIARAIAFASEPPRRSDRDRGATWDYVGIRNVGLQRWSEAADAFAHTAETTPSPRVLMQWAYVDVQAGDFQGAQGIYRRLLDKTPGDHIAWEQLAVISMRIGDAQEARRAAMELLRLKPGNRVAAQVLSQLAAEDSLGTNSHP